LKVRILPPQPTPIAIGRFIFALWWQSGEINRVSGLKINHLVDVAAPTRWDALVMRSSMLTTIGLPVLSATSIEAAISETQAALKVA
jgi:hypothetical protein